MPWPPDFLGGVQAVDNKQDYGDQGDDKPKLAATWINPFSRIFGETDPVRKVTACLPRFVNGRWVVKTRLDTVMYFVDLFSQAQSSQVRYPRRPRCQDAGVEEEVLSILVLQNCLSYSFGIPVLDMDSRA